MPGPVSDAYDPEWGTRAKAGEIRQELEEVYEELSAILGHRTPMNILELVQADLPNPIPSWLTEKQWRLLRFAVERARESI